MAHSFKLVCRSFAGTYRLPTLLCCKGLTSGEASASPSTIASGNMTCGCLLSDALAARGYLRLGEKDRTARGHPADTFLDMAGWGKGLVWVNGFNLGWYWPLLGPQMTTYIPGPLLRAGANEIVLLEFSQEATDTSGTSMAFCCTHIHWQHRQSPSALCIVSSAQHT